MAHESLTAALSRYFASPAVADWLLTPTPVTSVTVEALHNSFVYAIDFEGSIIAKHASLQNACDLSSPTSASPTADVEDLLIMCSITDDNFALGVVYGLSQPHIFASTPLMLGVQPVTRRFAVDLKATASLEFMELTHFRDRKICCVFRNFLHCPDNSLPVVIRATLHAPALPFGITPPHSPTPCSPPPPSSPPPPHHRPSTPDAANTNTTTTTATTTTLPPTFSAPPHHAPHPPMPQQHQTQPPDTDWWTTTPSASPPTLHHPSADPFATTAGVDLPLFSLADVGQQHSSLDPCPISPDPSILLMSPAAVPGDPAPPKTVHLQKQQQPTSPSLLDPSNAHIFPTQPQLTNEHSDRHLLPASISVMSRPSEWPAPVQQSGPHTAQAHFQGSRSFDPRTLPEEMRRPRQMQQPVPRPKNTRPTGNVSDARWPPGIKGYSSGQSGVATDDDQSIKTNVSSIVLTPHILGPVLMRAESFEAVRCPVCRKFNFDCACTFEKKCCYATSHEFIRGWAHFTSRFASKAAHASDSAVRLSMWANVPTLGEIEVLFKELLVKNYLLQEKERLALMRRKAVHGLGLKLNMPRVDEPLLSNAVAADFLDLHNQFAASNGRKRSSALANISLVTGPRKQNVEPLPIDLSDPLTRAMYRPYIAGERETLGGAGGYRFPNTSIDHSPTCTDFENSGALSREPNGSSPSSVQQYDDDDFHFPHSPRSGRSLPIENDDSISLFTLLANRLQNSNDGDINPVAAATMEEPLVAPLACDEPAINPSEAPERLSITPIAIRKIRPELPVDDGIVAALDGSDALLGDFGELDNGVYANYRKPIMDQLIGDAGLLSEHPFTSTDLSQVREHCSRTLDNDATSNDLLDNALDPTDLQYGTDAVGSQPCANAVQVAHCVLENLHKSRNIILTTDACDGVGVVWPNAEQDIMRVHDGDHLAVAKRRRNGGPKIALSSAVEGARKILPPTEDEFEDGVAVADERRHSCSLCERKFKMRGDLQRHVKLVHEKKKMYTCDECGKHFGHSGHLNRHKASHRGERRFQCNMCGFSFFQASHLASHIDHIHSSSRGRHYECSLCRLRVPTVAALREHLNTVHHVSRCPVNSCGQLFESDEGLARHMLEHNIP